MRVALAVVGPWLLAASALAQDGLEDILRRLDAEDATSREAAQAELESWCDRARDGAAEALRARLDGASAEVRARLEAELRFLADLELTRSVLAVYDGVDREAIGESPEDLDRTCEDLLVQDWGVSRENRWSAEDCYFPHLERAARMARWAMGAGRRKLAVALVERAQSWFDSLPHGLWSGARVDRPDLREIVASTIVVDLRKDAVDRAHRGAPRAELLARWKIIAALPSKTRQEEARRMTSGYESLLAEDECWKALRSDQVAVFEARAQVEYWMHALRDVDAVTWLEPGCCQVVSYDWREGRKPTNAADQLVALDWAALPSVIAHLDDTRPTRSLDYGPSFLPISCYLLSYRTACAQVFEAITETNAWSLRHDPTETIRLAAERWWKELGSRGPEETFLSQLDDHRAWVSARAATRLLRMDAQRHLDRVLARTDAEPPDHRCRLLDAVAPFLTRDQQGWLEGLLGEGERMDTVAVAAEHLLTKCDSTRGLEALASRIEESGRATEYALRVLGRSRRDCGVHAFVRCLRKGVELREDAMEQAPYCPDRRIADALVEALDDRRPTGAVGMGGALRTCDEAALSLARMVGSEVSFAYDEVEARRDESIQALKTWWRANRDSIDWDKRLREQAEASGVE